MGRGGISSFVMEISKSNCPLQSCGLPFSADLADAFLPLTIIWTVEPPSNAPHSDCDNATGKKELDWLWEPIC